MKTEPGGQTGQKGIEMVKQKIIAGAMIILGALSLAFGRDATAAVFIMFIGLPLMFSRTNYID